MLEGSMRTAVGLKVESIKSWAMQWPMLSSLETEKGRL